MTLGKLKEKVSLWGDLGQFCVFKAGKPVFSEISGKKIPASGYFRMESCVVILICKLGVILLQISGSSFGSAGFIG